MGDRKKYLMFNKECVATKDIHEAAFVYAPTKESVEKFNIDYEVAFDIDGDLFGILYDETHSLYRKKECELEWYGQSIEEFKDHINKEQEMVRKIYFMNDKETWGS